MYTVIDILTWCIQSALFLYILIRTFPLKDGCSFKLIYPLGSVIIGVLWWILFHRLPLFILLYISSIAILFIFSVFLLSGDLILKLGISVFLFSIRTLTVPLGDVIVIRLLPGAVQPLKDTPFLLSQLISCTIIALITVFLVKFRVVYSDDSAKSLRWILLTNSFIISTNLVLLINTFTSSSMSFFYNLLLLAWICVSYFLAHIIFKSYDEKIRYQMEIEQLKIRKQYEEEVLRAYKNMDKQRHDFKNHVIVLESMLRNKQYDKLELFFKELQSNTYYQKKYIETGNLVVDTLINYKIQYAKALDIQVAADIYMPDQLAIGNIDISSVLSNMLDNAIEACQTQKQPWIKIEIFQKKAYLYFSVSNSIEHVPVTCAVTSKEDKISHGHGITIINEIAQRYDGFAKIEHSDEIFTTRVMLKNIPSSTGKQS